MDEKSIRLIIGKLLQTGRLPYDGGSNVSGRPAAGQVCAACGTVIADKQLVMEATVRKAKGADPISFHVLCFELWNDERRKPREQMA